MAVKVLHVLHYSLPIQSEGYALRTHALMRAQQAAGLDVVGLTGVTDTEVPDATIEGIRYLRTPALRYKGPRYVRPVWRFHLLSRQLDRVIESERPDILHVHSPAYIGLAALRAGARRQLPVIYEMRVLWEEAAIDRQTTSRRSLTYKAARSVETHVLKKADAVVAICRGLRDEVISRGVPSDDVFVVPNGVQVEQFPQAQRDESLARSIGIGKGPVFGFIGSLFAYEGVEELLDAVPTVIERLPSAQFLIVGGGFREAEIKRRIEQWHKPGQVFFRSRVPHNQVQAYYSLIDGMVYARRSLRLTELVTPLKPLEAMALGKVVIASDIGGHREHIQHNYNGFLFPPGNVSALADAICEVGSHQDLCRRLIANGRDFILKHRTWSTVINGDFAAYERVLAKCSSGKTVSALLADRAV